MVSFGQTKEELELCLAMQSSNFMSDSEAENALDKILNTIGASKNFVLTPCSEIKNAAATSYKGIRYILYDKEFMQLINSRTSNWSSLAILAHEVGHHINGHAIDITMYAGGVVEAKSLANKHKQELEADEFAGFVMAKLGADLNSALSFTNIFTDKEDTYSTHPSKSKRVNAVRKGFMKAGGNSSVANTNNAPPYNNPKNTNMSVEEYINRGLERKDSNNYNGAISDFSAAIRIKPDYDFAYFQRGSIKDELKDYYGAISDYSKAIELNPNFTSAYNNRGIAKLYLDDYNGAISDYSKVIELNPNKAGAYYLRGVAKHYLKDDNGAISDFSKAIELNPNNTDFYFNRGIIKGNLKDYNGAISDYSKAIELNPNYTSAYYNRGIAKDKLIDSNGAISDFSKAIELNPNNAVFYYNRGIAKHSLGYYYGAISDHSKAIELNPNDADAYLERGDVKYFGLSDLNGACADWKKASSLGNLTGDLALRSLCE
jgi:tetratricopeptide (TPR) repeat protein